MFKNILNKFKLFMNRGDKELLVLPIKRKWLDMIVSGEKKEEYREYKEYYHVRFKKTFGSKFENKTAEIVFRNGYNHDSPSVRCKCQLKLGYGKEKWGGNPHKECYILKILEVLEVRM